MDISTPALLDQRSKIQNTKGLYYNL